MNILFLVDQAAALAAGINAPSSTVALDVDPAHLSEIERQVLAAVLVDGFDATRRGLQTVPKNIEAAVYDQRLRRVETYGNPLPPMRLLRPDCEGMHAAIAQHLAARELARAERAKEAAKAVAEAVRKLDQFDGPEADRITEYATAHREADGAVRYTSSSTWGAVKYRYRRLTALGTDKLPDEVQLRYERAQAEAAAEKRAAFLAAQPAALAVLLANEERARAVRTEYEALYARLPQGLRERHAAGYASDEEIASAVRSLIIADSGLVDSGDTWSEESAAGVTLDDAQFAALKDLQGRVPEDAEVTVRKVWDIEVDEDGQEYPTNLRHIASVTWYRGGVQAAVNVRL
jgi:hypothetical protein